jgi:hypothetical protein
MTPGLAAPVRDRRDVALEIAVKALQEIASSCYQNTLRRVAVDALSRVATLREGER